MPPILRSLTDSPYAADVERLIEAARTVRPRAWAKYSGFNVGAAILTYRSQEIFAGANVEGVDYDVTHAEESAFSAYVASGTIMAPVMIVAVGAPADFQGPAPIIPPCGKCRQKIYEWVRKRDQSDIDVIVRDPLSGEPRLCSIRELLPLSFG